MLVETSAEELAGELGLVLVEALAEELGLVLVETLAGEKGQSNLPVKALHSG